MDVMLLLSLILQVRERGILPTLVKPVPLQLDTPGLVEHSSRTKGGCRPLGETVGSEDPERSRPGQRGGRGRAHIPRVGQGLGHTRLSIWCCPREHAKELTAAAGNEEIKPFPLLGAYGFWDRSLHGDGINDRYVSSWCWRPEV